MRNISCFAADTETTVYDGQENTEVWAAACVELYTEDVHVFNSLKEQLDYFISLNKSIRIYYHNLKFDGSFILDYLLKSSEWKPAVTSESVILNSIDELKSTNGLYIRWEQDSKMKNKTFKYIISRMGQWYSITLKSRSHTITIFDSYKLLPFALRKLGKDFDTKHKKLEMEYSGYRYAGCEISDDEKEYIKNDVLVLKEALEIMFNEGHNNMTIGSCCMHEFKKIYGKEDYDIFFPDVYKIKLDEHKYGSPNAGEYIRKAYKGGWCYVKKDRAGKTQGRGRTYDVNSLYPSVMSSESGCRYPVGKPHFWKNEFGLSDVRDIPMVKNKYYFIRVKTRFYLKQNYLPFIQIKGSSFYPSTQCLETSDINIDNEYFSHYIDEDGSIADTRVTMTLTCTDFERFTEFYELVDFEILDLCYFDTEIGIFDKYIEKYRNIKITSKGARRQIAKLFLNNLYGKMATSQDSSFKWAYIDDGVVKFVDIYAKEKKAGYIPVGAAITSYARDFTIRAAQSNYDVFVYADTDSIHCLDDGKDLTSITVHPSNFCCWKEETRWDTGFFSRAKTYIEHVIAEDGVFLSEQDKHYLVKCAGLPEEAKKIFELGLKGEIYDKYHDVKFDEQKEIENVEAYQFLTAKKYDISDFKEGLVIPGKLMAKRINGGVILVPTTFEMIK